MSFTDGKPFIATEKDLQTRWSCGKPGEKFRCGLCGHKFAVGEMVRWQYTNDVHGACGNPFVCTACDGGRDKIVLEICARRAELNSERNWWFRDLK